MDLVSNFLNRNLTSHYRILVFNVKNDRVANVIFMSRATELQFYYILERSRLRQYMYRFASVETHRFYSNWILF